MATALDYRPPSAESQYDPQTVEMMKQLGIWHPGLKLSPGTDRRPNPAYVRENELMQHVMGMRAHQQNLDENIAARKEARNDYATNRFDTASLLEKGRSDRASEMQLLRQQAEKDRVNQGLIAAAHETLDPAQNKAIMAEYYKRLGVTIPGVNEAKPVAGEYGPGGAKVGPTATSTPAPNPYALPTRLPIGQATATPAGYDYNVNTGEFVRKDQPGFINGQQVGGTAPAVRALQFPHEEAGPTPTDLYGPPTPRPTADVGNPFDQFIMNLIPNSANKQKLFGSRANPNYVPPPDGNLDYAVQ